jgi:hypothetical protein
MWSSCRSAQHAELLLPPVVRREILRVRFVSILGDGAMAFFRGAKEFEDVLKWIGIMIFFALVPAAFLKLAEYLLLHIFGGPGVAPLNEFSIDLPMIMLAFWSGTMGSIVSYAYERVHNEIPSQPIIIPMAKFLFGGIVGAASFFLLRTAFIIKLLYPKIDSAAFDQQQLVDYRSVVAVAVICGLIAPFLVRNIRRQSQKL